MRSVHITALPTSSSFCFIWACITPAMGGGLASVVSVARKVRISVNSSSSWKECNSPTSIRGPRANPAVPYSTVPDRRRDHVPNISKSSSLAQGKAMVSVDATRAPGLRPHIFSMQCLKAILRSLVLITRTPNLNVPPRSRDGNEAYLSTPNFDVERWVPRR